LVKWHTDHLRLYLQLNQSLNNVRSNKHLQLMQGKNKNRWFPLRLNTGGVEVRPYSHIFVTSALNREEWSASPVNCLSLSGTDMARIIRLVTGWAQKPVWTGWRGEESESLPRIEPQSFSSQPVTVLADKWATPADNNAGCTHNITANVRHASLYESAVWRLW
jgi:hypothetical protein